MKWRRWAVIVLVILIAIGFSIFEELVYKLPDAALALSGNLSAVEDKAISLMLESATLLITLSYGVFAVLAYLLKDGEPETSSHQWQDITLLVLTIVAAITSIYCGHLQIAALIEMMSNDFLNLRANVLIDTARYQFLSLGLSMLLLVAYAYERKFS